MAASSSFSIEGTTAPAEVSVAPAATIDLVILSLTGVSNITWTIDGSSDSTLATPTITPAGAPSGATASFPMTNAENVAFRVKAVVNTGTTTEHTTHGIVGVPNELGKIPYTLDEGLAMRSASDGWMVQANSDLRGSPVARANVNTPSSTPVTIYTLQTQSNTGYLVTVTVQSRSGTTESWNRVRFLYKNKGGTVTQVGSDDNDLLNSDGEGIIAVGHSVSTTTVPITITGKVSVSVDHEYFVQLFQMPWPAP